VAPIIRGRFALLTHFETTVITPEKKLEFVAYISRPN
jgi:hypothetical protein